MTLRRQPCTMEKRAVRQIPRADRYAHAMPFISNALNIPKLYTYSFQIFLYKYHNQELPNILQTSLWQMKHFMNMIPDKEINSDLHWLGAIRGQEQWDSFGKNKKMFYEPYRLQWLLCHFSKGGKESCHWKWCINLLSLMSNQYDAWMCYCILMWCINLLSLMSNQFDAWMCYCILMWCINLLSLMSNQYDAWMCYCILMWCINLLSLMSNQYDAWMCYCILMWCINLLSLMSNQYDAWMCYCILIWCINLLSLMSNQYDAWMCYCILMCSQTIVRQLLSSAHGCC